jgi:hypothetical protein
MRQTGKHSTRDPQASYSKPEIGFLGLALDEIQGLKIALGESASDFHLGNRDCEQDE